MKKLNNKGFAISTLIYGVLILFVLIMSVLIATLNFRYRSLSDISSRAEEKKDKYPLNIGINLYASDDTYTIPYSGTYTFSYIGKDTEENDKEKECSLYLEKDSIIKHNGNRLFIGGTELNNCKFDEATIININKVETENKLTEDISGANMPDLRTGLVPVKYNETKEKWVVTTADDPEWYDYSKQKWANAVSLDLSTSANQTKYLNEYGTYKKETELTLPTKSSTASDVLAMFVWIPRYSYTIGCTSADSCLGYRLNDGTDSDVLSTTLPGAIDIKFINSDVRDEENASYTYNSESRNPDNYYTHPAFTFDDKELSGIWVGKFETSVDISSVCYTSQSDVNCNNQNQKPIILPNVSSVRFQNVKNQFETAQKFTEPSNDFRLIGDAHMMKNSEWGAVAYLSQSIYGKYGNSKYSNSSKEIYINNFQTYITGGSGANNYADRFLPNASNLGYRYSDIKTWDDAGGESGGGASTTGNIYGIYDMNGSSYERVLGRYKNLDMGTDQSGFTSDWLNDKNNLKYFDIYDTIEIKTSKDYLGSAFREVNNWYNDNSSNLYSSSIDADSQKGRYWLDRGNNYAGKIYSGIFTYGRNNGSAYSATTFRVSLVY